MKKNYLLLFTGIFILLNNRVNAQCLDQAVTPVSASVICNGSGTIGLASSQAGVNYYVRNDANHAVVSGPVAGTGNPLTLGTGSVGASMIYNIYAVKATGGLAFDGINNYVEITNSLNSNGNFTWEAWVKTDNDGTIFSKTTAAGTWSAGGKSLFIRNGKVAFEVFGVSSLESYSVYNDNNWHHIAVTAEMGYLGAPEDRVRMYIDGVFAGEKNNWNINADPETGYINRIGYTNSDFPATPAFKGVMDEVKIWNTVRTATDITTDMTGCLTGLEAGLVAYYQFENGSGTVVTDVAGADNNGTLINMLPSAWVYGRDECGSCSLELSQKPVFVITTIADQTLTAASLTLCSNVSTTINAGGSETGVNYYLRNNASYTVVNGPVAGTGGPISFSTGIVANTTTYNVIAARTSGALNFDGVDDYVLVRDGAALESLGLSPYTIEAWVYPTNITAARSVIRKDGDYSLYINNGFVVAQTFPAGGNGGAYTQATSATSVSPNVWTHIATVWNGTAFTIYINGISSPVSTTSSSSPQVSKLCIGKSKMLGQPFAGKIDEVRMWTSMRTVSQLTANINSCLTGTETSLIAYYKFNEGTGTSIINDQSPTNAKGILSNMNNVTAWSDGVTNCGCTFQLGSLPVVTSNSSPTVSVNSGSICSGNSFTIVPSGAGSYTITGGTFTVTPGVTTSYSVTGTNGQGCVSSPAVSTITVSTTPTITVNNFTICSGSSVAITPTGAATYTITGGVYTVTPASTTSYSVTGTNTAGCVSANAAVSTISVNTTPTISVNSGSICSGRSFTLAPSGAGTYTVSGGNFTVTPSTTTAYSVTGTSTNGCVSANTATTTVTVNITPTLSVNSATICSGNSVVITPTGAAAYTITGNTFTVTPAGTTSYSVTGTSTAGCLASNTAVSTVSVGATPTITVNSGSICSGSSFTIVPSGASSYTITGNTLTVSPAATAAYSVTGSNGSCMATNTAVANIIVSTTPTLTINSASICSGGSVALMPSGAGSYTITGNNYTVSPTSTTSYSLTGSNAGCAASNTAVATVSVYATPTITINSVAICAGSMATLTPGGAGTYTITGGSYTVSPTANTIYSVTGTSTAGCASANTAISNVTVNPLPTISVNNGAVCPGNTFTLAPTGASSYTYSGGSNVVSPGVTTSYTITGTSAEGCHATNTAVATVSVVNTLSITVTGNTTLCAGQSTTLTANGASTYTWNGTVITNTFAVSPTSTGIYTIMGASGTCSNTAMVTVSVNPVPVITVNSGSVCSGNSFTIVPAGAVTYTYSGGSAVVSPAASTNYSVTGSSALGCISSNTAISLVNVISRPVITAATINSVVCLGEQAVLSASGGTAYTWSDAQTGGSITITPTGTSMMTYTVTGNGANGCTNIATVSLIADNCTGINSTSSPIVFGVYPNPTKGQFMIESAANVNITVVNALGAVVHSEKTTGSQTTVSIEHLANGIYFVKAVANGQQHIIKIVKE